MTTLIARRGQIGRGIRSSRSARRSRSARWLDGQAVGDGAFQGNSTANLGETSRFPDMRRIGIDCSAAVTQ